TPGRPVSVDTRLVGLDWGVETIATLCYGPHQFEAIQNDRLLAKEQDASRLLPPTFLARQVCISVASGYRNKCKGSVGCPSAAPGDGKAAEVEKTKAAS